MLCRTASRLIKARLLVIHLAMLQQHNFSSQRSFYCIKSAPLLVQQGAYISCALGSQVAVIIFGSYALACLAKGGAELFVVACFLSCTVGNLFSHLIDICAADYPVRRFRFSLSYLLRSPLYSAAVSVHYDVPTLSSAKSVRRLYAGAVWLEREV